MADAAVTFLLETVKQLLETYFDLIAGAKNELEQLNDDLDSLKALLHKAEDMANKDEYIEVLERQIRDVVHKAEDTIDTCLVTLSSETAEKPKRFSSWRGSGHDNTIKRISLAKEVKSVRDEKVTPMLETARKYLTNVGEGSHGRGGEQTPTTEKKGQLIREDDVVGFTDEEETIINYLNEESEELDVISIIGMPGLGKTTLAWKIYQNDRIQDKFPIRIWIDVSKDFNRRDVFLNILKRLTELDMSSFTDTELVSTIRSCLSSGKFFLVLDDIWNKEAWNEIQYVLPKKNGMGKVLITSRDMEVGTYAKGSRDPLKLGLLDVNKSWELLQLEVFRKLNICPKDLEKTGKIIAKQCQGLPLSLIVIGGFLREQVSRSRPTGIIKNAWINVSQKLNEHFKKDKVNSPLEAVALSYKFLPPDMRDCFLYLGVFPEDYEIPVWTLTGLWIAEGLIQRKEREHSLEEIAEEYLEVLINRNLVMVGKTCPTGKFKTCRIHDVIREFCKSKGSSQEQNMFLEVKKPSGVLQPLVSDIEKSRRLCIHSHLDEFFDGKFKGPTVRSFLSFYKDPIVLELKYLSTIPENFSLLRILDSKSIKFDQIPRKFPNLIHLRYITLCFENGSILPDLSSLRFLQTLVVDTKSRILEIKSSIWRLIQLRHLKTKAEINVAGQDDSDDRGGKNLQTLSRLSPQCCTPSVFRKASNLKQLGIRGDLAILLKNDKSLQNLATLETLKLKHDGLPNKLSSESKLPSLPSDNCFPPNIKRLTLSGTFLDWKHMRTLAMIYTLEVLKLKDNAFRGMSWDIAVGASFPYLQFLLIENSDLVFWEASNDHFPSLWCLVIKNCKKLSTIPMGLVESLQMLKIDNVPKSVVDAAKEIEKEKVSRRDVFKLEIGQVHKEIPY